jgi:exopolysaccharide biosynthesis operon protein EpsL
MQSVINNLGEVLIFALRPSPEASTSISLLRAGVLALISSLISTPAWSDTLQPFVSAGIGHDDNLLRLPDDQLRLDNRGGDTYRSVIGGLALERPIERQLFSGNAAFTSMKFDRYSQLDYVGKNLSGEWHWFLAAHFEGHIGGSYAQGLAPFVDFHVDQRNLRVTKNQYADGSWRFHPSWQWRSSYIKYQYVYDLLSQRHNDRTEESLMTGIDYLAPSGSTIGFQLRRLKGSYPYGQSLGTGFFGNDFTQEEAKVNIMWLVTGRTQIQFLGGWVQRKLNARADRVDSGTNARLVVNWTPVGRVKLVGQAWREFSAIEGALVDSALTTGSSAGATWDFSEKIQGVADLKHESRKFTPSSGVGVSLSSASLSDSSNAASVGLAYKPLRSLTLKISAFREQRSGSVAAGTSSYKANGASFNVIQQF